MASWPTLTPRKREAVALCAMLLLGALLALPNWGGSVHWTEDSLFYEAQKREVLGAERHSALRDVFSSAIAAPIIAGEADLPSRLRRFENASWVAYSSQFFHRRWTVSAAAAALDPVMRARSLEAAALLGYIVLPALLYLLLRRRFRQSESILVSAAFAASPPVHAAATVPGTDGWALSLLVAGLLLALLVRERGLIWLPAWIAVVLALSFTRDLTAVILVATGWLAVRERSRAALALVGTGVVASLPALLIFSAPLKEYLAWEFSDFRIPSDTSWGFILGQYPSELAELIRQDLAYPLTEAPLPPVAMVALLVALAGLVKLFLRSTRDDAFIQVCRGAAVGGLLTLLGAAGYSGLRLEMALVPSAAAGVALLADQARAALRARRSPSEPRPAGAAS